jgi:hypothetical protein
VLAFPHGVMMLFEMLVLVLALPSKLERASFPPWWNNVVRDELVRVQEGMLTRPRFPSQWNDVVRNALVLVQEGKIACASFPSQWNDFV